MLRSYSNATRRFSFTSPHVERDFDQNTFTIMVGRNGTGKSRLLRSVVTNLLADVVDHNSFTREERINFNTDHGGELDTCWRPTRIICASSSPFDRFPLPRRDHLTEGYSYLGLRGLPSANLGLAYMSRVMFSLLEAASRNQEQAGSIVSVLQYLGYQGAIGTLLQLVPGRLIEELLIAKDPAAYLHEYLGRSTAPFMAENTGALRNLLTLTDPDLWEVVEAARRFFDCVSRRGLRVTVTSEGLNIDPSAKIEKGNLLLLAQSGLLRLRDVFLYKDDFDEPIKLHDASSGEQAVVMGLLGIGSHITHGALVCIDEPEVCLHPEWQEKYIELLFHTFRQYRGCHFLIATHSPQIVAQIPDGNCFVMSMEDGTARSASDFSLRSIDFQLAEVFNAPGFGNEYLSRIALNAFARVAKAKRFDEQSRGDLSILRRVGPGLQANDPLRELIIALEEMAATYE